MRHTYSIYDLKSKLSQALKLVSQGQQIIVTDRGKPTFQIIPFKENEIEEDLETRVNFLEKQGILKRGNLADLQPAKDIQVKKGALERFLKDRNGTY